MLDSKDIDAYFNADSEQKKTSKTLQTNRHSHYVRTAKLILPSLAALLIGILLIIPSLKKDLRDFRLDITRPKKGELEKLHVENTVFYITDSNNRVNNFVAKNIDETAPGSKLVLLEKPEGIIPSSETIWTNLKAPSALYNQTQNIIELQKDVELFYSEGMSVQTEQAFFDFNQSKGYGSKPVTATGFLGNLSSQGFEYDNQNAILTFTGHTDITLKEESIQRNKE